MHLSTLVVVLAMTIWTAPFLADASTSTKGDEEFPYDVDSDDVINPDIITTPPEDSVWDIRIRYDANMDCPHLPACTNGVRALHEGNKDFDGNWKTAPISELPTLPTEVSDSYDPPNEIFVGYMGWEPYRCHSLCKALRETTNYGMRINAMNLYWVEKTPNSEENWKNAYACYCVLDAIKVQRSWGGKSSWWKRYYGRKYESEEIKGANNTIKFMKGTVYSCGVTRKTGIPDQEWCCRLQQDDTHNCPANYHELETGLGGASDYSAFEGSKEKFEENEQDARENPYGGIVVCPDKPEEEVDENEEANESEEIIEVEEEENESTE